MTGTVGNSYSSRASTSVDLPATSSSFTIWAGLLACGDSFNASAPGAGANDPGYALITLGTTLKNGSACTGQIGINAQNTLLSDNKLVVLLSDPNAAFTASINSVDLPVVNGYASLRVKGAWEQDPPNSGNWKYIELPTCSCSSALSSCMPIDASNPPDAYFGQTVKLCAADYTWMVGATPGTAKYFATIIGVGNDPAMGWQ